jgi:hypothetical protein
MHLLIEVNRGEKPLQSCHIFHLRGAYILASADTKHGVMKSSARGKRAGALFSRPAVLLTFSSSVLAADFPFHFAASPGTHFVGAAPKLPPQHRPCRCEKMGNGMRNCSRRVTHLAAGGNFQFSQRYQIIVRALPPMPMLGLWGVNYLQRVSLHH